MAHTIQYNWNEIRNLRFTVVRGVKLSRLHYLEYEHINGKEKFLIVGLTLKVKKIQELIYEYLRKYGK